MKTYAIIDNEGTVHASDILSMEDASNSLSNHLDKLTNDYGIDYANELELEIVEQ